MNKSGKKAVLLQTLAVAGIGLFLIAVAQPLYPLISKSGLFEYSSLRFILGSVYGWLLGIGNFFAMAVSLIFLTSSSNSQSEGQKKAQAMYMSRLVAVLLLAVGGCFIPVFHPAAILISLALTQFGISVYAMIFRMADRTGKAGGQADKTRTEEGGTEELSGVQSVNAPRDGEAEEHNE